MTKKSKSTWHIYILRCGDGSFYTGITTDIKRRVKEHKDGVGAKYTRGRGPLKLVYRETCKNRSVASKREAEIKRMSRKEKLGLIGTRS